MLYLNDMGQGSYRAQCWICGTVGVVSRFHLATPLAEERGLDGSLPPGLYEFAGNICPQCVVCPQDAVRRFCRWFDDSLAWNHIGEGVEWLKTQSSWLILPQDAIILPLGDTENIEQRAGRWVIVDSKTRQQIGA